MEYEKTEEPARKKNSETQENKGPCFNQIMDIVKWWDCTACLMGIKMSVSDPQLAKAVQGKFGVFSWRRMTLTSPIPFFKKEVPCNPGCQ